MFPATEKSASPEAEIDKWLIDALDAVDVNNLTPLEALNTLAELKREMQAQGQKLFSNKKPRRRQG